MPQKEIEQPLCWRGSHKKDGWDIKNYLSPPRMDGGDGRGDESKVCKLKDKKTDYSLLGGGSGVRIFLCAIFHNQFPSEMLTGSFTVP